MLCKGLMYDIIRFSKARLQYNCSKYHNLSQLNLPMSWKKKSLDKSCDKHLFWDNSFSRIYLYTELQLFFFLNLIWALKLFLVFLLPSFKPLLDALVNTCLVLPFLPVLRNTYVPTYSTWFYEASIINTRSCLSLNVWNGSFLWQISSLSELVWLTGAPIYSQYLTFHPK